VGADFGLARAMNNDDIASTFCGTMPWTAPEIFTTSGYTTKADVYSFGTF
jgi:serine/threonine protein kinase